MLEDLISTGKSSIAAAQKLREAGIEVLSVASIFSYDFSQAQEIFRRENLVCESLSTFEILAKVAYDNKLLNEQALEEVLEWRKKVVFPWN